MAGFLIDDERIRIMKTVKMALIGYGNVGQGFARMLKRRSEYIKETYGCNVIITAICTHSKGAMIDESGIDTENLDYSDFKNDMTSFQVIDKADFDVMAELTPINIKTGQPAIDHIKHGLSRGKHVITANKGPIAWDYRELRDLAIANKVTFFYEATVMDGVPVYDFAKDTLKGCNITEIKGILNATTNYILNAMENDIAFEDAVKEGQRQGFVEADPSMDVEGWDAAAKLTALMNVIMDAQITPNSIKRKGISGITKKNIDEAKENHKKIKLLCHGWIENGQPIGEVSPQLVDDDSLLASISGTTSVVTMTTDLMGDVSVIEHAFEPEIDHTAYGVLIDLIHVLDSIIIESA